MKLILCIMDGWGIRKETKGNAILAGNTSFIDELTKTCPSTQLKASGNVVGLPEGYMGNSEVGHITIGSGRIVWQMLERINQAIHNGEFKKKIEASLSSWSGDCLHIMGMTSDKGVHAQIEHLLALLEIVKEKNIQYKIHVFTDGRDTSPHVAKKYLAQLKDEPIATISGRYYAMDRDKRWDRTQKAYEAIVLAKGEHASSCEEVIDATYERGDSDEYVLPTVIGDYSGVHEGDAVLFFNYRLDRARQLSHAFLDEPFLEFDRVKKDVKFITFTEYYSGIPSEVLFSEPSVSHCLGEVLSSAGLKQVRIAETEKYAHVTYFFNGQREEPFANEERIIIPSPKVARYDETPEMKAREITDAAIEQLPKKDVIILNYSNGDMIGHTGNFDAAVKAVGVVNACVEQLVGAAKEQDAIVLITADHGNCEEMSDADGKPLTAHSTNLVPFIIVGKECTLRNDGGLCDIAPTILKILDLEKPSEMSGKSLL